MQIGFIGVGNMGSAIVRHLLAADHSVSVYARSARSRARLHDSDVNFVDSAADLGADAEVVFTMVTGSEDVEQVVLGEQGAIHGMQPNTTLIDMTTMSPVISRAVAARLAARNIAMLDAPVSGGPSGALAGSLTMCVGGDRAVFERVRGLLSTFARTILYMGPHGAGLITKLANQIAQLACLQGAAEALLFAQRQGVDPGAVRQAVLAGLGSSRMMDMLGEKMIERDFTAGIVAALHHKDLGIALAQAHDAGLALPVSAQVMQQLNALIGNGWGENDTSILLRVLEQTCAEMQ